MTATLDCCPVISTATSRPICYPPSFLLPLQHYCCPSYFTYYPTAARISQETYVQTTWTTRVYTPLREDPDPRTLDQESERTPHWSENLERGHHGARYRSEEHHGAITMERDLGARILEPGPWTGIYGARTLDWTLDRNLDSIILSNQKAERIFIAYYCLTINSLSSCLTLLLVRVSQNVRY